MPFNLLYCLVPIWDSKGQILKLFIIEKQKKKSSDLRLFRGSCMCGIVSANWMIHNIKRLVFGSYWFLTMIFKAWTVDCQLFVLACALATILTQTNKSLVR